MPDIQSNSGDSVDLPRIERAVREILAAVGEDPDREGLLETPARVARMYAEMFSGLHTDPRPHLQKFFTEKYDEVVLVQRHQLSAACASITCCRSSARPTSATCPTARSSACSKLARVVEVVSRRPQVQERMTEEIANLLVERAGREGRGGRHRSLALLHDDPRRAQAGQRVRHLGHEGHLPLEPFEPVGSDAAHLRQNGGSLLCDLWPILVQFLLRLIFGVAAAMGVTPPRLVTAGFFRVHLWVLMGLGTVASLAVYTNRVRPMIGPAC